MNCDDCGDAMAKPCLCLIMFSPLDEHDHRQGASFHRISNLCERCQRLKLGDVVKAYPPRQRATVRQLEGLSEFTFALEHLKTRVTPWPAALSGKPLWLYGKGELGQMAQDYFRYVGVEVAGTFEHDEEAPIDSQVAICIVRNAPYGEIEQRLWARGHRDIAPFYDLTDSIVTDHPWKNGWTAQPRDINWEGIERVLGGWSDDVSKAHYLQFLAWRITREEWVFKESRISKDNMFFIPQVVEALRSEEVFLDGGAYHGEMSHIFRKLVPDARVIEIEPDDINRGLEALPFALSDLDDRAPFAQGFGLCSKLMPDGRVMKQTCRIDDLGITPTFIKLHLEGGELPALRGAKETLLRSRPIVAARVDHNSDGLGRTANWLMNLLSDYRFLFRNHCWCGSAAVVYAIPEERYA